MNKSPGTSTPTKPYYSFARSPNQSARSTTIKRIILHYTTSRNLDGVIAWFRNTDSAVSAHYIIATNGKLVQMVSDSAKAWHTAGNNNDSIGIEICAQTGDTLTAPQTATLTQLLRWLLDEYHLNPDAITAHGFVPGAQTSCPGDLWKTKAELDAWVRKYVSGSSEISVGSKGRPYEPCPVPLPWEMTLGATFSAIGLSTGKPIYHLQCALIGLGYLPTLFKGELVGDVFNEYVEDAVRKLQKDHGLEVDGIVGAQTRSAIERLLTHARRPKGEPVASSRPVRAVFSMDLEPSSNLRAGKLEFLDERNAVVRREPATSGIPNFQTHDDYWTRRAGPIPPGTQYMVAWSDGWSQPTSGIEGWGFHITPDPVRGPNGNMRSELLIHRDANVPGTAGCIGLLLTKADYDEFVSWAKKLGNLPLEVRYT